MKYLKMLGLAAVVATALMAFAGAGSASATALCTETPINELCPVGKVIDANTDSHIQANITHGAFFQVGTTSEPLVTCTKGKVTATINSATTATINTLDFADCEGSSLPVIVQTGQLHINHSSSSHKGTVTLTNTQWTINQLGLSCTYGVIGANTLHLGTVEGSTLTINTAVKKTAGSFLCGGETGWDTSVHLETPKAIFVGTAPAEPTTLCTQTPVEEACPVEKMIDESNDPHIQARYTHGELFTVGKTGSPLITCTSGALTATMNSATAATLNSLSFSECEGSATPTIIQKGQLHIERKAGTHAGTVRVTETQVTVNILGVSCTYGVTGANTLNLGSIEGSTLTVSTTVKKTAGGFLCPTEAGWDTKLDLETPSAIYAG